MPVGEYLTSNTSIAYPFRDGQNAPEWLLRLFVDASIASNSHVSRLTFAEYSSSTGLFSFEVDGKTFQTSVVLETGKPFGKVEDGMSSFILDMQYLDTLPASSYNGSIEFEPACVFVDSDGISSFLVYDGTDGTGDPVATLSGDVSLLCGYNISLSQGDDESSLSITAKPGAGLGVVPCQEKCEEDPDTNGQPLVTDDGHAVITGDGCYEVTAEGDTIQLHGKCVACCQCQSYVDVVEDLKEIASDVKNEKDRITVDQTEKYFGLLKSFAMDGGKLEMDVQVDISPDTATAEAASRGEKSLITEHDVSYFRVTCTVTNLSGVPCSVTVPDTWQAGDYGTNGIHYISGYDENGALVTDPSQLLCNGIQVTVASSFSTKGDSAVPSSGNFTINPTNPRNSAGGWLVYSRVRGPRIRKVNNRDQRTYQDIVLQTSSTWKTSNSEETVWDMVTTRVLNDLNNGENPSQLLAYAEELTHEYANGGFIMPAGYSFTITNVYALHSSTFSTKNGISALFRGYAFAPMLLYSSAYNRARPETHLKTTSDGVEYCTTWNLEGEKLVPGNAKKTFWGGCTYRYDNNKTYNYDRV